MIQGDGAFDGATSRDFCFIDKAVQMNLLAATADDESRNEVYNIAVGDRATLNTLYKAIKTTLSQNKIKVDGELVYIGFTAGDVCHITN